MHRPGVGRGKERGSEKSQADSTMSAQRHDVNSELEPRNHEIMTWAKIKSQMLNGLSHPGALQVKSFLRECKYLPLFYIFIFVETTEDWIIQLPLQIWHIFTNVPAGVLNYYENYDPHSCLGMLLNSTV